MSTRGSTTKKTALIALPLAATILGGIGIGTATGSGEPRTRPASHETSRLTPDDCIRVNGGDYNACNVGNSGRGDLPYRPAH